MAISFNGTNQSVYFGEDLGLLADVPAFSLMTWIRPSVSQNDANIFSISIGPPPGNSNTGRAIIRLAAGSDNFLLISLRPTDGDAASTLTTSTAVIAPGQWQHVGFSYNCATRLISIYRNGNLIRTGTANNATVGNTSNTNAKNASLATNPTGSSVFYNGDMEDARVYGRLISADEFKTIYTAQGRDFIFSDLQASWLLQAKAPGQVATGSGSVTDMTGQGMAGTPINSPLYTDGIVVPRRSPRFPSRPF